MKYLILFIPFFVSFFLKESPELSYLIAWFGSFFIFFITLTGKLQPLPKDLPLTQQFMRPVVLTQLIFAGYMACTSIFHFLDAEGYYYFDRINEKKDYDYFFLLAKCQRFYCLSHASFVLGILLFMRYSQKKLYTTSFGNISGKMVLLSLVFSGVAAVMRMFPSLDQFYLKLGNLSLVASVIAFSFSLIERKFGLILVGATLFFLNLLNALMSGWKESVLVLFIMLSVFLYPRYKKTVTVFFPIMLVFLLTFLPTYVGIIRGLSWYDGETEASVAAQQAFEQLKSSELEIADTNWEFLINRFSEIKLFIDYVQWVPEQHNYFGTEILEQAIAALVPKVIYPDKPALELLVMERVYEAGIANELSVISAKPQLVVDGYLSGGFIGVFVVSFVVGSIASITSQVAEKLFGSYTIGSGLIFTGIFQIFWRGNCVEYMLGSVFWSWIIMLFLFWLGRRVNFIKKIKN